MKKRRFKHFFQLDAMDCGASCLRMIANYYGKQYTSRFLRDCTYVGKDGVSLLGISEAAIRIGFNTEAFHIESSQLMGLTFPVILHWNGNHFVVLLKILKKKQDTYYHIADPAHGVVVLSEEKFMKSWANNESKGVLLHLEPTDKFNDIEPPQTYRINLKLLIAYLMPYKRQVAYMGGLMFLGSVIALILPFLTQLLIDDGVSVGNVSMITKILAAQLFLYLGNVVFDVIRNWLVLTVGTKLSINIISNFLKKVLQLPISFFDSKLMGDFNQRIQDNERVEDFLTSQGLTTLFSIISFSVFFAVLWYYDLMILLVFLSLTVLAILWSLYWLRRRKILDYHRFQYRSENQESIFEILSGVTDLKLNQLENYKRASWEKIQLKLFKTNVRLLKIEQLQFSGFNFFNHLKNIITTYMAAIYVVNNEISLGALLSISYIIGQLNSPVDQLFDFFRSFQDAKLSLERLAEVQGHPSEEQEGQYKLHEKSFDKSSIQLANVSFQYEGPNSPLVLNNVSLIIPKGKTIAIVGESGSGKTTLLKLLLKFYDASSGIITFNNINIKNLSALHLRKQCGTVMQDSYIFSDTIEKNIVAADTNIDVDKMKKAAYIASIDDYIESLPLKYKTKVGNTGNGLSIGQKQRILIARAVYKNPQYLFFDEATNALDATNEKQIVERLKGFFLGRTVIVVAHRLSTVKNADQIIVLNKGKIVEVGNHFDLTHKKGNYYSLVKDQLDLGL